VTTTWRNRPDDVRLPLWLRVTAVAETRAHNGVALLDRGELRRLLDPTGHTSARVAANAVRQAIDRGLLAAGSTPRALIIGNVATQPRPGHTP
jgi:hypothetical protein